MSCLYTLEKLFAELCYVTCTVNLTGVQYCFINYVGMSTLPYLSVLKPGSNIRRVVQQNERNKRLGSFKRRVPKLLNLINLKMVPNVKEN